MYTRDFKQFSVKVKVPWGILYHQPKSLGSKFEEILRRYLTKKFRVTSRVFLNSLRCRFTVIFQEAQRNPEAIDSLIDKVAQRTITSVVVDKSKK